LSALANIKITIVGLGLLGGSLALALRGKCARLIAVDTDPQTCELALQRQVVDEIAPTFAAGVAAADLLVLATPVRVILKLLAEMQHLPLRTPLAVIDLGSTKSDVQQAMTLLPDHYDPIGGHPMCGKEFAGLAYAEASLFQAAKFVLTPLNRTSPQTQALAQEMVAAIGARCLVMGAARHDRAVSVSSHLPYIVACSAVATAADVADRDPTVAELCASGFRDTTRVAACDVTMMFDILYTNRNYVRIAIEENRRILRQLAKMLDEAPQNPDALRNYLEEIRQQRFKLLPDTQPNVSDL
jgi:prephenate dehydrogenase